MNREPALPLARFLDPRPAATSLADPICDSINIPLEALPRRMAELPPPETSILVAATGELARETLAFLESRGRKTQVATDFQRGAAATGARLWQPNELLLNALPTLPKGRSLDLGCGGGRDAVYMTSEGWNVHAVDRLPDGIERGSDVAMHYLAADQQKMIRWECADVLKPSFQPDHAYDLIAMFFFFDRDLVKRAIKWLAPGGTILIEAFTTIRQEQTGKPTSPARAVRPGEMAQLLSPLQIVSLEEAERSNGHTVRAWATLTTSKPNA
jgi:tellurite methyltransferase